MMNYSFIASSRIVSSIMITTDSFNASTVRSMITLSKSVRTFRNAKSVLLLNTVIIITHSKAVSQHIAVSTAILSMQLDSSNTEFTKNS